MWRHLIAFDDAAPHIPSQGWRRLKLAPNFTRNAQDLASLDVSQSKGWERNDASLLIRIANGADDTLAVS